MRKRVVRLLLQAVTSECLRKREKKRESERERGRGREGERQWMREGEGGCCRLKKQKSCSVLSHRKTLGLEEAQGSCASHQLPICHSLTALSNRALSRLYQWRLRQWNGRSLQPACLSTGTPGSVHTPQGPTLFLSPPFLSCFCYVLFSTTNHIFFFVLLSLVSLRSLLDFFVTEGKQGF